MRALLVVALMSLVACGPTPSVELSRPTPPAAPQDPAKPTTPSTDPGNGNVSTEPTPTATPVPPPPRLRAVCADDYSGDLHTITSQAKPTDGVARLDVADAKNPQTEVKILDNPVPVAFESRDVLVVVAEGAPEISVSVRGPERLYLVKSDLPMRKSTASDLGAPVAIATDVEALARRVGIQARNFGASDAGTFLILPRGKSFDVVSRATLAKVATLALDPAKTLMPQIFENENLATALVYDGGAFKLSMSKIAVQAGTVKVGAVSSLSPGSGSTLLAPSILKSGVLTWTEFDLKKGGVTFVTYDSNKSKLERARLAMLNGERLAPHFAVVNGSGTPLVAVAIEKSQVLSTPMGPSRELLDGRLAYVKLSLGTATEIASFPYPVQVIRMTKTYGFEGEFAAKRLLSPTGGLEALLSIDVYGLGEMLYKPRAGALDGVGGLECQNPNVIEEVP